MATQKSPIENKINKYRGGGGGGDYVGRKWKSEFRWW